ncbi:hypothetical protein PT974_09528 [Cladobotryum mycophilum]|uniref:MFS maltose permease n=1 Tax=Cladobotryum mycophilum TaxID=491253 RepID=A0ABR0SHN7_9HYPO
MTHSRPEAITQEHQPLFFNSNSNFGLRYQLPGAAAPPPAQVDMAPRIGVRRVVYISTNPRSQCFRSFAHQTCLTTTGSRPILPFLFVPKSSPHLVRYFTSERKRWWKHEAKLVARYTFTLWGAVVCVVVIFFAVNEEVVERAFPTPHEWHYLTRKYLRDANNFKDPKNGEINWARALELSRGVVIRLEDPKVGGENVVKLSDIVDPNLEVPGEFIACDISAKSEEWRRGYFEAIMLAAKAAEHVDGWLRDTTRNIVSPQNCELAYPAADNWYVKILATKGLTPRQKIEAALEYASFLEFKNNPEGAEALYRLALAEATHGSSKLPYDAKALTLKHLSEPPSTNLLDALTAMATHKARKGDVSAALPIYLSVLKARRSLSNEPPRTPASQSKRLPLHEQILKFLAPPDYPPPPPDGTQAPWRSTYERCQEASLNLYIGEILYATGLRDDGLAWTRDGVDQAEEQLHGINKTARDRDAKQTCRECLSAGLGNWSTMVARLAKEEQANKESGSKSTMFSFWSGPQETEGRWAAEEAVVQERTRRTKELLEEVTAPTAGITSLFKA